MHLTTMLVIHCNNGLQIHHAHTCDEPEHRRRRQQQQNKQCEIRFYFAFSLVISKYYECYSVGCILTWRSFVVVSGDDDDDDGGVGCCCCCLIND